MVDLELMKISLVAEELNVTTKTIYNWITDGKLTVTQAGYVDRFEAHKVWHEQQSLRSVISFFQVQGTKRDANGRFTTSPDEQGN
jgi:hypothetical protein